MHALKGDIRVAMQMRSLYWMGCFTSQSTPSLDRLRQAVKAKISRVETTRGSKEVTVEFEYDLTGNRTSATINDGGEIRYIDYFYDEVSQLIQKTDSRYGMKPPDFSGDSFLESYAASASSSCSL